MEATVHTLYQNEFCGIHNFLCECQSCATSKVEFQSYFSFCFVRKGTFQFKAFNEALNCHNGYTLLNKPGYEYRVAHKHTVPDQCTILRFSDSCFDELKEFSGHKLNAFLKKPDMASILIRNTPEIEHLHHLLFGQQLYASPAIQTDWIILKFIEHVFEQSPISNNNPLASSKLANLSKIEEAKYYLESHFIEDISLSDLSKAAGLSMFHFARSFKIITGYSPYDYLLKFRCAHANWLLKNTSYTVQDVAFLSGFNDSYNFSTTFRKHYGIPPSRYRNSKI